MKNKKKKGFTLVELIAVIAILAVLAAVAIPNVIKYIDNAKAVAAQTEAGVIYNTATAAYTNGTLQNTEQTTGTTSFDNITVGEVPAKLFTKLPNYKVIPTSYTMAQLSAIINEPKDKVTFEKGAVVVPTSSAS